MPRLDLHVPTVLRRSLVIGSGGLLLVFSLACAGFMEENPMLEEVVNVEPPEEELIYFYIPGKRGEVDAKFAEWKAGDELYVGVHDVNLRSAQDTSSDVLDELPVGMRVEILESGKPEILTQRRNRWYRVRTTRGKEGWVFGAALSPVHAMLDGKRGDAPAVVTFSPDFKPRVRVRDPAIADGGGQWSRDVTVTTEFDGGVLTATVEPIGNGKQLVVEQCDAASERCGIARVRLRDGDLVAVE